MGTSLVVSPQTTAVPDETTVFDRITYTLAAQFLSRATQAAKNARKFVEGDHWQQGDAWQGPKPPQGEDGYQIVMDEIERAFVVRDALNETLERHATAVMGHEPVWGLTPNRALKEDEKPTQEEQNLIDEAEAFLTDFWDKRSLHEVIQAYTKELLWGTRSSLRVYPPTGRLRMVEENGQRFFVASATDVADALMRFLWVEHPSHEDATVYTDPNTQEELGIVKYNQYTYFPGDTSGFPVYELTYLDPETNMTVIRRQDQRETEAYEFDLGGRLTLWESTRSPLVTEAMITAQKALNLAVSMLPRNVVTGGFLERVLLNAQLPGEWILDAEGQRVGFKPSSYKTGSGTTNFVTGAEYKDESGNTRLATPSIQWRPPSDTEPVIKAAQESYFMVLAEAKQLHILLGGSETSGVSKEQSRADFKKSTDYTVARVNPAGRWLLETLLAFGEQIAGRPGYYTKRLRATFECRVDLGPVSVEERNQNVLEYEKGVISMEECMARNGVLDVDAEKARMKSQPEARLALLEKQMGVLSTMTSEGFSVETAGDAVGLDEKLIQKYTEENAFDPTDEMGNPIDTKTGLPAEPIPPENLPE